MNFYYNLLSLRPTKMKGKLSFHKLQSNETGLIDLIAGWYFSEWNIPVEYTRQRLTDIPNDDVILQMLLLKDNKPIATGGIYNKVGLAKSYPALLEYNPWIALLYTSEENRNKGYGTKVLLKLESISNEMGFKEIFLHTFSAEKLYIRNNWIPFDEFPYKGHNTVVMRKEI